ncbi:hypothetical protein CRM71_06745 [Prevotella jejuni]|jgi:hypothetical protein|uniref:Uncharacterized protein n=2 Tax=Prevotella jejuni TaxID=1177574 RepID=A0A2K9H8T5_9BACT|nr:hypothetical protein CRM71_06745 [Prevotella jejuni]SNS14921.1 hypothetical protein SAMN06265364_1516 [Prevotella jejuni]
MDIIVPVIIIGIVSLQIFFFLKNLQRMKEFKDIFKEADSWNILYDEESHFVSSIAGKGNETFQAIKFSINKYLRSHTGSVVDFNLLKDAVDRHCDSVEEDINTQTPVPLYCGLAGTMIGVIIGLSSLLYTNSITSLLGGNKAKNNTEIVQQTKDSETEADEHISQAADGVNDLLTGVAWAMLASILGIGLTTANSLFFKKYKLEEESGKNDFYAWMQSQLLPELPSDTSDILQKLVSNLNRFNNVFSKNTKELGSTLSEVNRSYEIQADIIGYLQEMDIERVSAANILVLKELQGCTNELKEFQTYLKSVQGYTTSIQKFTELFNSESERLHVLEDIKTVFQGNKDLIAKDLTSSQDLLKESMIQMRRATEDTVEELRKALTNEMDNFDKLNKQLESKFTEQLEKMPKLYESLNSISKIPSKLEDLAQQLIKGNERTASALEYKMDSFLSEISQHTNTETSYHPSKRMPLWQKMAIGTTLFIVCFSGLFTSFMVYKTYELQNVGMQMKNSAPAPSESTLDTLLDSLNADSTAAVRTLQ